MNAVKIFNTVQYIWIFVNILYFSAGLGVASLAPLPGVPGAGIISMVAGPNSYGYTGNILCT